MVVFPVAQRVERGLLSVVCVKTDVKVKWLYVMGAGGFDARRKRVDLDEWPGNRVVLGRWPFEWRENANPST